MEEHCEEAGALVIYTRLQYRPEEPFRQLRLPRVVRTFAADCLILAGTNYGNLPDALDHSGVPYVYLGNNLEGADRRTNGVFWDDIGGAAEATRYLIELGHREIWYLGDTSRPWLRRPFEGYVAAMQRAGLPVRAQTAALASEPFQNGKASMEMLLEQQTPCTAIIADAEELEGTFAALDAADWVAPRDVSVVAIGSLGPGREDTRPASMSILFRSAGSWHNKPGAKPGPRATICQRSWSRRNSSSGAVAVLCHQASRRSPTAWQPIDPDLEPKPSDRRHKESHFRPPARESGCIRLKWRRTGCWSPGAD